MIMYVDCYSKRGYLVRQTKKLKQFNWPLNATLNAINSKNLLFYYVMVLFIAATIEYIYK